MSIFTIGMYADDLSLFRQYVQEADSAYKHGDTNLCFKIEADIISLFEAKRKTNVKNNEICTIAFNAYGYLAISDKRKTESEARHLLANGLALVEDNPSWIQDYPDKNHIVNGYVNLIGGYVHLGDTINAIIFNKKMLSFAEKHYKFEIAGVLLSACLMYSLMHEFDRSYPLYQRLYEMFDDLDRFQQYKVVRELIHFEYKKENYSKVAELSYKHEKLISKSKDEVKESILNIICFGLLRNAQVLAKIGKYSENTNSLYKSACMWAKNNNPVFYPTMCIDYACWLYSINEQKAKALVHFESYLDCIENCQYDDLFDERYRNIEDAENALISIMIQEIVNSETPIDINAILRKYPKIVMAINNSPDSRYYEDFNMAVELCKKICYGTK